MIVDDNFLTEEEVQIVQKLMLKSEEFPWFLNPNLLDQDEAFEGVYKFNNLKTAGGFQFNHGFYMSGIEQSKYMDMVYHIFTKFITKHGVQSRAILRAKANLTTQDINNVHVAPHVDHFFDHSVFLYYVNDSDGDTIIYNEKWQEPREQVTLTEKTRVSPKAGRAILFDGRTYHTPLVPVNSPFRAVINLTFV